MLRLPKIILGAMALLLMLPLVAQAQTPPPVYTQAQIDQMVAPIALYPDPLVSQIFMAATYPLEVVEASRWLQNQQNTQLQGDQLAAALEQQPWDPSVKALVNVPQVLTMLDGNLQWTEQLGNAFLAEQPAVMDSVQRLRQMAEASGHLASTPQETVSQDEGAIEIEPANPQTVYVPYYNPMVVYGAWPYPGYQPYYFPPPPGFYLGAGIIGFGVGIGLVDVLWGWDRWDWHHHRIDIDDRRFAEINRGHPPVTSGQWSHDPAHRQGVPYRSPATRAQYQGSADQARRNFRGYPAPEAGGEHESRVPAVSVNPLMHQSNLVHAPPVAAARVVERTQPMAQVQQRQAVPIFESFARRSDVQAQSQRGAYSRSTTPAAAPRAASRGAPAARPVAVRSAGDSARGGQNPMRH